MTDTARIASIAAYSALGVALVASRTIGLEHSFWTDEIIAVEDFVRAGPREILAGSDLSHELFGILAWLTGEVFGESEVAYRLWSVLPFLAGVALVTWWLHVRLGPLAGVLFLLLATVSPLLLDITRQARGYGLAFLAMSVLVVAALEAAARSRTAAVIAVCVAGVVGTTTLPQFGIAFVATAAALLLVPELRRRLAVGLAVALIALGAWYAPHLAEVGSASQIEDGLRIDTWWLWSAPIDQILLPALIWIDGTALVAGVVWLPLVVLAAAIMAASPLVRSWTTALILISGPVATVVVLWIARAYVIPRYLSYLLVPLFILLATGAASLLQRRSLAALVPAVAVLAAAIGLTLRFGVLAPDVVRFPREANRDAAEAIRSSEPPRLAVVARIRNSRNLEHYLGRPVAQAEPAALAAAVCEREHRVAYVLQPFAIQPVEIPCLMRAGVVHRRFEQYARGGEMNVWIVPPR
jgi:hypothetical protein